jgi:hypothetical protein
VSFQPPATLRRITNDNRFLLPVQAGFHIMVPRRNDSLPTRWCAGFDRYRKNQKDITNALLGFSGSFSTVGLEYMV